MEKVQTTKETIKETVGETLAYPQTEGLSFLMKMFLIACIVLVCYLFVRAHSTRRQGSVAGRHGAYEKSIA